MTYECDCTYDGNKQNIGPNCQRKIELEWERAIQSGKELVEKMNNDME